jgi:hypothetical protein
MLWLGRANCAPAVAMILAGVPPPLLALPTI